MRIASFEYKGKSGWGVVDRQGVRVFRAEDIFESPVPENVLDYIRLSERPMKMKNFEQILDLAIPISSLHLMPPITAVNKNIFCVGKNYLDHIKEVDTFDTDRGQAERPIFFTKSPNTLNGPYDRVPMHEKITSKVDYEAELAFVIGKKGKNISREKAKEYIFGYTIINDVSARDLQKEHKQWFKGKSLDGFCPMGPWIATCDEIPDAHNLEIVSYVNSEIRQKSNTKNMIYNVYELISVLSQGLTLEPGDIIATGTPDGVGIGFNPPRLLNKGDIVRIEIQGIGYIENEFI